MKRLGRGRYSLTCQDAWIMQKPTDIYPNMGDFLLLWLKPARLTCCIFTSHNYAPLTLRKGSVWPTKTTSNYEFFSSIARPLCIPVKWKLRMQLGEREWTDLMFSLPRRTKLCTGALFIHQARPCSSKPLTKKFRINWQHQSGDTQQTHIYPPLSGMQIVSRVGKSWAFMSRPLGSNASCCVQCLTSSPPVPQGPCRNILPEINAVVCSDWGGKWRIVNDGQIIGVCWSSPSSLWSGDRDWMGVRKGEGTRAYWVEEPIWSTAHTPSTSCSYNSPLVHS